MRFWVIFFIFLLVWIFFVKFWVFHVHVIDLAFIFVVFSIEFIRSRRKLRRFRSSFETYQWCRVILEWSVFEWIRSRCIVVDVLICIEKWSLSSVNIILIRWSFWIKRGSWYTDTRTVRLTPAPVILTPAPVRLTLASQIRKKVARSSTILHAHCTRNALEVLQHKSFVDLLSWSSAFDSYKYDSKRAIFDVDYQVWKKSFLKLFQKFKVLMFFASGH
jgi:hypothetical protein